jgi:DNA-binding response OmpR family regulator
MPHILVVDDEPNIIDLARMYLEAEGYRVSSAANGKAALQAIRSDAERPDLMVLDIMMPEMDGWEVCRRVRAGRDLPIIMLTARDDDVDKIVGLELGADDYLTKPFNPRELVARVKAVLRRYEAGHRLGRVLELAGLRLDRERREVTVHGEPVSLRTKEFDLLRAFMENRGIVLTREQLLDLVWGYDFYGESRTVDVHVTRLRSKIAGAGAAIETVRNVGYKLVEAPVALGEVIA